MTDALQFSSRVMRMEESSTLALAKKVRALKEQGRSIISLTLGEPDFDTPEHVGEAAIKAVYEGDTHYPPVSGIPALRQAICTKLERDNGLVYKPSETIVSTGAKQSLINVLMALLDPGDEVIVPAPYWVSYLPMVFVAGGQSVVLPTNEEQGLKLQPEQLEAAISERTKALILNNPVNPTGVLYSEDELRALADVLKRHPQVWVLADEIYERLTYDQPHTCFASIAGMRARTATINGVSKAYAMTGWRIGYMAGPEPLVQYCDKIQGQFTSGASSISQRAAVAALSGNQASTEAMRKAFMKRRDLLCEELAQAAPRLRFSKPAGAFYLYPNIQAYLGTTTQENRTIATADDMAEYLIEKAGVAVVPSTGFGTSQHIRLSYACSEEDIRAAARQMGQAMEALV